MIIALDDLTKAEMMSWANKQYSNSEDFNQTVVMESEARGRIQAYRNILFLLANDQLCKLTDEDEE